MKCVQNGSLGSKGSHGQRVTNAMILRKEDHQTDVFKSNEYLIKVLPLQRHISEVYLHLRGISQKLTNKHWQCKSEKKEPATSSFRAATASVSTSPTWLLGHGLYFIMTNRRWKISRTTKYIYINSEHLAFDELNCSSASRSSEFWSRVSSLAFH